MRETYILFDDTWVRDFWWQWAQISHLTAFWAGHLEMIRFTAHIFMLVKHHWQIVFIITLETWLQACVLIFFQRSWHEDRHSPWILSHHFKDWNPTWIKTWKGAIQLSNGITCICFHGCRYNPTIKGQLSLDSFHSNSHAFLPQ